MDDTKLNYSFTTFPDHVRVSVGGDEPAPSQISLLVMIDNPTTVKKVSNVKSITIDIPAGASKGSNGPTSTTSGPSSTTKPPDPPTDANRLSTSGLDAATLTVDADTKSLWDIHPAGSTITITPTPGNASKTVTSTIMFWLEKIEVNESRGIVPISVKEAIPISDESITVGKIEKLPADKWVKDFWVEYNGERLDTPVLYDIDQTITLKWKCTSLGESKSYRLKRQANDREAQWENDGLSCNDGSANTGKNKLVVTGTSTFELDVLDPGGTQISSLTLTVVVTTPHFSNNSYARRFFSGRLVSLHWSATNAGKCHLTFDGNLIDDHAPADTYTNGYLISNPLPPQTTRTASVIAYARKTPPGQVEPAQARFESSIEVKALTTIPVGKVFRSLAITPDGNRALGTGWFDSSLTLIDLAHNNQVRSLGLDGRIDKVAIAPDGSVALALHEAAGALSIIDLTRNPPSRVKILPVSKGACDIGFVKNESGTWALIPQFNDQNVLALNFSNESGGWLPLPSLSGRATQPQAIAVSPDGKFAVVTSYGGPLMMIDLATWTVSTILDWLIYDSVPFSAITPDGKFIVIAGHSGQSNAGDAKVINILDHSVQTPAMDEPTGLALTPDGRVAIVANSPPPRFDAEWGRTGTLKAFTIANPEAQPITIPFPLAAGVSPGVIATHSQGDEHIFLLSTSDGNLIQGKLMEEV